MHSIQVGITNTVKMPSVQVNFCAIQQSYEKNKADASLNVVTTALQCQSDGINNDLLSNIVSIERKNEATTKHLVRT